MTRNTDYGSGLTGVDRIRVVGHRYQPDSIAFTRNVVHWLFSPSSIL